MGSPVIESAELTKSYGSTTALRGVSIQALPGEITGMIGPDGAGKSSFMKILLGLLRRDDGDLKLFGGDPGRDREIVRNRVGYMPEIFSLYTDLSVEENLRFSFRIHRGDPAAFQAKRDRLYRFNRLQAFSAARAGTLSGGMKQKLALSCALMHDPELLVLDEPTTGVDPLSRGEFWSMLKELKASGMAILVSTPYMEEALQCDRIYLMNRGEVLAAGEPRRLIAEFPGTILEFEEQTESPQDLRRRLHREYPDYPVYLAGRRVHLSLPGDQPPEGFGGRTVEPDLEDLFLSRILASESA